MPPIQPFQWGEQPLYNPKTGGRDRFLTVRTDRFTFDVVVPEHATPEQVQEILQKDATYHRATLGDV